MTQQGDAVAGELATEKVGIKGYLAFFLTIIFFSGVFSGTDSWWRVFDFSVLNGSFGQLPGANGATTSFRGAGGAGAKDGFLFALELAPSVILSLGIISITDGQIFLESDLFFEGQRPAVNVGLSVSRVGGAAQTKAMKKASGSLRINLAQYREMKEFTQFASDLDDATKRQLQHGQVLMELLKQPLNHPMSHADMVIILVVADAGILDDLNSKQVKKEETKLLDWFNENHSEISREINTTRKLDDNLKTRIITLAKQYRGQE